MFQTLKKLIWDLRFVLLVILLMELIYGVICLNYSQLEQFRVINAVHAPWADTFFRYFTHLGDGLFIVAVGILLVFARYKYAILTVISFLLSGLVAQGVKKSVKMPRPGSMMQDDPTWYTLPDYHIHGNYSFPSGHTTSTFALVIILYYVFPSQRNKPTIFLIGCLVGYSRVYLSQHWMGDVFVGAIVGSVVSLLVIGIFESSKWYNAKWANSALRSPRKRDIA